MKEVLESLTLNAHNDESEEMADNATIWSVSIVRILGILLIGFGCSAFVHGQTTIPSLSDADYNEVLDRLFPRLVVSDESDVVLVVRYEPSFAPESQIIIVRENSRWRLFRQQSESGNVYVHLGRMMEETGRNDLDWLVTQVSVKKQEMILPQRKIEELQRQLINSLSRELSRETAKPKVITKGTIAVVLDETRYRIWYRGAMKIEFAIWGSDTAKRTRPLEPAVVRWAKRLHSFVSAAF